MTKVTFYGYPDADRLTLELDEVPRQGDIITLDSGTEYRIKSVHWQLTSKGLKSAGIILEDVVKPD